MPFSNPDFPGRTFSTIQELEEAQKLRKEIEEDLELRSDKVTPITARVFPSPEASLEKKVEILSQELARLSAKLNQEEEALNKDSLPIGMVLQGESKGSKYTLEVIEEGYLCSTGHIEPTLSAAAERVSGNRRSGWAFWKDGEGRPIGEVVGRSKRSEPDPHLAEYNVP